MSHEDDTKATVDGKQREKRSVVSKREVTIIACYYRRSDYKRRGRQEVRPLIFLHLIKITESIRRKGRQAVLMMRGNEKLQQLTVINWKW
jgi:hypothetical protein